MSVLGPGMRLGILSCVSLRVFLILSSFVYIPQRTKPKHAKGAFERMARMPRNQLLDALFTLFRESPRWSIRPLRDKTQQPEVYLKEVLQEIAMLHKSGEHNGLWELKDVFKEEGSVSRVFESR